MATNRVVGEEEGEGTSFIWVELVRLPLGSNEFQVFYRPLWSVEQGRRGDPAWEVGRYVIVSLREFSELVNLEMGGGGVGYLRPPEMRVREPGGLRVPNLRRPKEDTDLGMLGLYLGLWEAYRDASEHERPRLKGLLERLSDRLGLGFVDRARDWVPSHEEVWRALEKMLGPIPAVEEEPRSRFERDPLV
jgi:hypothetical protein